MSETFTTHQVQQSLRHFLDYGETSFCATDEERTTLTGKKLGHRGVFSGDGFDARCLRWYLAQLERKPELP